LEPAEQSNIKRPKVVRRFLRWMASQGRYRRRWVGTLAINLTLYAVLVVAYFFVVLQWLNEPLAGLFRENMGHYALVSVLLILGQGLLLDIVTSSLLRLAKRVNGKERE
jgi:hypothetical protein